MLDSPVVARGRLLDTRQRRLSRPGDRPRGGGFGAPLRVDRQCGVGGDGGVRTAVGCRDVQRAHRCAGAGGGHSGPPPFGLYDCSLVTDGAAFLVLTAEDVDTGSTARRVRITGSGHGGDTLTLHGRESQTSFAATRQAAATAYGQAGVAPGDIDLAEVHDCFTITQIINTEDLGFFEAGRGGDAVAEGRTARDGDMPINTFEGES